MTFDLAHGFRALADPEAADPSELRAEKGGAPIDIRLKRLAGLAGLALVALGGACDAREALACCSCVCETATGDHCTGARVHAYAPESCELACHASCEGRGCVATAAEQLADGPCPGGWLPFL